MKQENLNTEMKFKKRFKFGENWRNYIKNINDDRIKKAENSLKNMLHQENLNGKFFLDIGSGSGLFSLAARNLGASVLSFDFDETSVWCTKELKKKFYPEDNDWKITQGSILDKEFLATLNKYDYVYSWGVLHHTGNMWEALNNVIKLVKFNGTLFISIYNKQQFATKYWTFVKRTYVRYKFLRPIWFVIHFLYPAFPSMVLRFLTNRKDKRGMVWWNDLIDWIGGYPFETATPSEIFNFYKSKGFSLIGLNTVGGKLGCNEYVFCFTNKDKYKNDW